MSNVNITELVESERFKKALNEISIAIDNSVESMPFVEPQLAAYIEDSVALQLLQKETQQNQVQYNELYQIYQEIIEDVLYAELELKPLEAKRNEMWNSFTNSTFAQLLDKYKNTEREEAEIIAKLRNELNDSEKDESLQNAVYDIQEQNKSLNKEIRKLDAHIKKVSAELVAEKKIHVDTIDDDDEQLIAGKQAQKRIQELSAQIDEGEQVKTQLESDCESLHKEIDQMMEELVALNNRSVASKNRNATRRKK